MDNVNRFETKATHTLARAEWFLGLVTAVVVAIIHIGQINWAVFIGLFLVIDLIGYIPGAIAYRRSSDHRIPKGYYVAYNVMHSLLTSGAIAAIWSLIFGPEWALLALPIHLFGDRALFGNTMKPFGISFEPVKLPQFEGFERAYRRVDSAPSSSSSLANF
ncbi:hypothetical protein VMT65_27725 [Nocardia sp. CDC153]|uniref:hypothetical protein n=1 Tax=Nocardia sp. CDC153 TaxID=3112167 RepID=UPI002DBC2DED|nr:hypothetical protein [Nocardia sp. CDC153]MEC3956856.1 hypothetical protein [Nocardia sp. CDC153]